MGGVRGTQSKVFWHFQAASEGRVRQLESQTSYSFVGGGAVIGQFEGSVGRERERVRERKKEREREKDRERGERWERGVELP